MSDWDDAAGEWDGDEATRTYAAAAFASLVDLIEPDTLDDVSVLDFGCGTGLMTELLVEAGAVTVAAVDTSPVMLAVLDTKIADQGWTNVATSQELPSGRFDLIVCSSVLAFVDDYPATAAALAELLTPGGRFVQWDWERVDDDPHGLGRTEIVAALERAGLDRVAVDIGFEAEAYGQVMRPLMGSGRRPS